MQHLEEKFFNSFVRELFRYTSFSSFIGGLDNFKLDTKNKIDIILNENKTFSSQEWDDMYDKNILVSYAIVSREDVPKELTEKIAKELLKGKKSNEFFNYEKETLFKCLERDIDSDLKLKIIKRLKRDFFNSLSKYSYDTPEYNNNHFFKNGKINPCPYNDDTLKIVCNIFLDSKSYQKSIFASPFRFIKDEDYIKQVFNDTRCNDKIMTAIANNCYISAELRMEAVENASPENIYLATDQMKNFVYESIVMGCIENDTSISSLSKTELETFQINFKLLQSKIESNFFNESQQLDLVNRVKNMSNKNPKNAIIEKLAQHSIHNSVICELLKLQNIPQHLYYNNNLNNENFNKLLDNIYSNHKLLKNNNYIVRHFLDDLIRSKRLEDKFYDLLFSKAHYSIKLELSTSYHTPDKYLDLLINEGKNQRKEYMSDAEIEVAKTCETSALLTKILNKVLSEQDFLSLSQLLKMFHLSNSQRGDTKIEFDFLTNKFDDRNEISSTPIAYYKYSNFNLDSFSDFNAVFNTSKTAIQKFIEQNELSLQEKDVLLEAIDVIDCNFKLLNMHSQKDYSWCAESILDNIKTKIIHDFFADIMSNPACLLNNFDEALLNYSFVKDEENYRYDSRNNHSVEEEFYHDFTSYEDGDISY